MQRRRQRRRVGLDELQRDPAAVRQLTGPRPATRGEKSTPVTRAPRRASEIASNAMCDWRCSTSRPATSPTAADSASPSVSSPRDQRVGVVVARPGRGRAASASQCARLVSDRPSGATYLRSPQWSACATSCSRSRRCWSSPPSPSRRTRPRRRPLRRRRPRPTAHRRTRRRSRPRPRSSPASRPTSPRSPGATRRRSASPARKGRLRDGVQLPELGEDFFTWDPIHNRDPEPRVAPLGHRPPDPHRADRPARVPDRARQRPARRDHGPLAHPRRHVRPQLRRARPRVAPERPRRRHPLPAQGRHRGPRRSSPHRSIASSRRTSSTASSRPAR